MNNRFLAIILLLLAGFMAGAQLGKLAPLVPFWQASGMGLVLIGWLVSAIALFIALGALPAGLGIERAGLYRSLAAGCILLALGAFALAASSGPTMLLGARLVEGAGYLLIVIAAPGMLARISPDRWRPAVMGLWGGFVPIGFAFADGIARIFPPVEGNAYLLANAMLFSALSAGAFLLLRGLNDARVPARLAGQGVNGGLGASLAAPLVFLSLAFAFYVIQSMAFFSFLPAWLLSGASAIAMPAGAIALFVPLGNVLASAAVAGRSPRFIIAMSIVAFAMGAVAVLAAFFAAESLIATAAIAIFAIAAGMTASCQFAALPDLIPPSGSSAVAIGFLSQAGGLTTLIAPPVTGWVIENWGYGGQGVLLSGVSVIGLLLTLPVLRAVWKPA